MLPSFDNIQKYCISLQRKLLFHLSNCVIELEHSFEGGKRIVKGAGGQSKVPPVPLTKNSLTSDKKIAEKEQTKPKGVLFVQRVVRFASNTVFSVILAINLLRRYALSQYSLLLPQ